MEELFVPFDLSLRLKKVGFNQLCHYWQHKESKNRDYNKNSESWHSKESCSIPTFSHAFKWFRDKYNLEGKVEKSKDFNWFRWEISEYNDNGKKYICDGYEFDTFELSEYDCLLNLIIILEERLINKLDLDMNYNPLNDI